MRRDGSRPAVKVETMEGDLLYNENETELPETDDTAEIEAETPDQEADEEPDEDAGSVVLLGDQELTDEEPEDEATGPAPAWVKELRKSSREDKRALRAAQAELAQLKAAPMVQAVAQEPIGPKPQLQDMGYDTEAYDAAYLAWTDRKRQSEAAAERAKTEADAQAAAWQAKQTAYATAKKALRLADYDDAEEVARAALAVNQQGMIVHAAKNPAAMFYALGKNPAEAKRLGAITDLVRFAMEIGKLEDKVKVEPRKPGTAPEGRIVGTGAVTTGKAMLEAARKRAEVTGDMTEVMRIKRAMAAKK
jgi:hypothetical protein